MRDTAPRYTPLVSLCLLVVGVAACTSRPGDVELGPVERLNLESGNLASFTFPYYTATRGLNGGGSLAVWMRREGPFRSLVYRRAADDKSGFGQESYLSPEDLRETISVVPTLLDGPDPGEVYALWQSRKPKSGDKLVVFRRSTDAGATWGTARILNSQPTAFIPALAKDQSGAIYAAWADERGHGVKVYFNRSLDHGETWLPADVRVDGDAQENPGSAVSVNLASDGSGNVVIVWEGQAPKQGRRIYAVGSRDRGNSWSAPVLVTDETHRFGASSPSVVFVAGRAIVVWTTAASGVVARVWSDSSTDGGVTWGQDVLLQEQEGGVPSRVHLTTDGSAARAVFHGGKREQWNVYYAETDHDGRWTMHGNSLSRVSPGEGKFSNPRLAFSAVGELFVTYQDERRRILLNRSTDGGKTWGTQAQVIDEVGQGAAKGTEKVAVQYPQIAVADGIAYVTWEAWADSGEPPARLSDVDERVIAGDLFVRRVRYRR